MARCETDVAFRIIVGNDIPDFRRIAEFRRRHLGSIQHLFLEVLRLCQQAGLVNIGRLSLDGTKVKANASRHKAMSYDRMSREEERLEKEIAELLANAQASDEKEDAEHGQGKRGDELPDELARREKRLAAIRQAKAALEQAAREKVEAEAVLMERRVYPAEFMPDFPGYRISARKCSLGTTCNVAGFPCKWAFIDLGDDPFKPTV